MLKNTLDPSTASQFSVVLVVAMIYKIHICKGE